MENEQLQKKTSVGKMALYLLGYFILGLFFLVINAIPIPLGGAVGAIRIWQWAKKDAAFNWKIRLAVLLLAIIIGSGVFAFSIPLHIKLNFGQNMSSQ